MRRAFVRALPLAILLAGTMAACSSTGERSTRNPNVITREEILDANLSNLYEAVERLRPRWLQVRNVSSLSTGPGQIIVYMNTTYLGGPDVLREFNRGDVAEVRYLDGPRAQATLQGYPSNTHIAGAIVIVTSTGGRP
jgi:hypothetical protein